MVLLNQKDKTLFDPIRKKWVEKTPEECIRQSLIQKMIHLLGYPAPLLAIEKELSQLPHLQLTPSLPKRRADLLVFARDGASGALFPLMLIECKALPLTDSFARQVMGYNLFVRAPYVVLANSTQVMTGTYDPVSGRYSFTSGLPPYSRLSLI